MTIPLTVTPTRYINQYQIGPTLGHGGFSKVRLGTHVVTGQQVALKIIRRDQVQMTQVERELNALRGLQHDHIITLHHVDMNAQYIKKSGHIKQVILVVLEYAPGGELFASIKESGRFEESRVQKYLIQLMRGVQHLHEMGTAHRDLKPENLLLDAQKNLKIADFGFAAMVRANNTTPSRLMYTQCGTTGYMAPEMFIVGRGYDPCKADIWACGVILFIMLAGFAPYIRAHHSDWWFHKLQYNKPLFWEAHCRTATFSDDAKDLIERMLCIDPMQRITIKQIWEHPFMKSWKQQQQQQQQQQEMVDTETDTILDTPTIPIES